MRRSSYHSKRRAVAGIIASAIFFTMLFVVGTSYFLSVNNLNFSYDKALVGRADGISAGLQETLIVATSVSSTNGHILFYANNTGGLSVNVTSVFVLDSNGNVLTCDGRGLPQVPKGTCSNTTPSLPRTINTGKGIPWIDSGYTYVTGTTDTIKVVTERGSIFSQTYPETLLPEVKQSITSTGSGYVTLNYATFRAYYTSPGSCNPSSTNFCKLHDYPTGANGAITRGYTLCSANDKSCSYYIFAADVTNVDPNKKTIVLDSNCLLKDFLPPSGTGGGTSKSYDWTIGSVSSDGTTGAYSTVTLAPGQTVTVYFSSFSSSSWPNAGTMEAVFIYLHGTKGGLPYGQAILFGTTVYT